MVDPGFPMIQVSNFGGKRICARKMDYTLKDVMNITATGACKSGFSQCQHVCVPEAMAQEGCPVNAIDVIETIQKRKPGFDYIDFFD